MSPVFDLFRSKLPPEFHSVKSHPTRSRLGQSPQQRKSSEFSTASEFGPFQPFHQFAFRQRDLLHRRKIHQVRWRHAASELPHPAAQSPASRFSSPGNDIPISSTAASSSSSKRENRQRQAVLVIKISSVFRTRSFAPNSAARISFVVVFPTDPVIPQIFLPQSLRTARAQFV